MTSIVWFRQDLRLADNPALHHAAGLGPVLPVYILDETHSRALGGANKWWLHHSLKALQRELGYLIVMRGDPLTCLRTLVETSDSEAVVWNRCYEPQAIARDKVLKSEFINDGLTVGSFNSALLNEPWEVATGAGGPYKVYSPYWRAVQQREVGAPLPLPTIELGAVPRCGEILDDLALLPATPEWAEGWDRIWTPGEAGAKAQFDQFLGTGLRGYGTLRDRPDKDNVSRLSAHLHFGEISPRQIWAATRFAADEDNALEKDAGKFLSEIVWREFAYHLLFHFPSLPEENWKPAFDAYPWREDPENLEAWQRGQTGYPIVDAGMRELWQTGTMHNRVRMIAASFLIKHLRIHWREGEAWFWDTLLDADAANNAAGWQWVAGSGADASPYFRIFNPMTQGRKFDPDGTYVRRWCPELDKLDRSVIHAPFEASPDQLRRAGVVLGKDYPRPIVDHAEARAAALAGYAALKAAT